MFFCAVFKKKTILTPVLDPFVSFILYSVNLVVGQLIENIKWLEDNSIETDTSVWQNAGELLFKQIALFIGLTFLHKTHTVQSQKS